MTMIEGQNAFCSGQRFALCKFHMTDSQNMRHQICVIRFQVIEGPNAHDQIGSVHSIHP